MGMKHRSLIDKINLTFIALTATAIHHGQSAYQTGDCWVLPEFLLGGGVQCKCNTTHIDPAVAETYADVFLRLDTDFGSSLQQVQGTREPISAA